MTPLPRLYVGCGLTLAPQDFCDIVEYVKKELTKDGHEVLEFIGLVKGTATDVWKHDLRNVAMCDHMIAFVDEPSIGLGIELNEAIHLGKPILCLLKQGKKVTRMVHGADELGLLSLQSYTTGDDAVAIIERHVRVGLPQTVL